MLQLVLASSSPRRMELLTNAGFHYRHAPVKVSEITEENLNPAENASHLATVKARAAFDQYKWLKSPGFLVLGSDTVVTLGDQMFGKPESPGEAAEFLRQLSGKTHSVISGLALIESASERFWIGYDETKVAMRSLAEAEIAEYVASGEPFDKAGGYAIQGLGGKLIESYKGSWNNVVGLPLERLESVLREVGWTVDRRST